MIIRNKTCFVYDIEIFPNFFCVSVKNTESKNKKFYQISDWLNEMPDIAKLFLNKSIYWVGFNSLYYDKPIISYILINYKRLILLPSWEITAELKKFSDKIINSETSASWSEYKYANLYDDLDLLSMKWSQKLRSSLKALQVTMEYPNVEEYSGDFNSNVTKDDVPKIKGYNFNDIDSTDEFLSRCTEDIELRLSIEDEYHISALNKDGVNLGMEIIKTRYLQETGKQWFQIKDLRSPCNNLCFNEIIFDYIQFKTPELQKLLIDLKNHCANPNDNSFERKFVLGGVEHTFGMGGLHSVNTPEVFIGNDNTLILDDDVASLYPSIIIQNLIYPQHLGIEFVKVYKQIRDERIEAKRNGDKLKNETLKLAINGLTGNLQSEFSWVYDPKAVLKIRINGQLLLLMYAESIMLIGGKIIQSNTDGLAYMIDKSLLNKADEVKSWWEQLTGLELEREEFERFYQYAINDYIGVKKNYTQKKEDFYNGSAFNKKGKPYTSLEGIQKDYVKKKGLFIDEPQLGKGLAPLIIPEALNKYFVEGIPPEETIYNCKDINRFVTFQKVKKDFEVFYNGERITHINRYYMSTNGGKMYKQKVNMNGKPFGSATMLCASSPVTIYNKFDNLDISERHINYQYYISEAYKIIEKMDKKQLSLW